MRALLKRRWFWSAIAGLLVLLFASLYFTFQTMAVDARRQAFEKVKIGMTLDEVNQAINLWAGLSGPGGPDQGHGMVARIPPGDGRFYRADGFYFKVDLFEGHVVRVSIKDIQPDQRSFFERIG